MAAAQNINKLNTKSKQSKKNKKDLQDKLSRNRTKKMEKPTSSFKWFIGIIILLGLIAFGINYDVNKNGHGKFDKSATGKLLNNMGILTYVEFAWYKTMSASARGYQWMEANIPIYYQLSIDYLQPVIDLIIDLYKISKNLMYKISENIVALWHEKSPIIFDFIEHYMPGLTDKITDISLWAYKSLANAFYTGSDFLKSNVFVGPLSSTNITERFNQTQQIAAMYYSWFQQKVDMYAKIK